MTLPAPITTPHGTTVSLRERGGDVLILLDTPGAGAPNPACYGRILPGGGGAQAQVSVLAVRPDVLRAIADLIEAHQENQ